MQRDKRLTTLAGSAACPPNVAFGGTWYTLYVTFG
jgi:hypothetical protein